MTVLDMYNSYVLNAIILQKKIEIPSIFRQENLFDILHLKLCIRKINRKGKKDTIIDVFKSKQGKEEY